MKVVTVLNPKAGLSVPFAGQNDVTRLSAAFRDFGIDAEIVELGTENMEDLVTAAIARRADAVVVAGGDGTVGAIAGLLAGKGVPLGVLPLGTFNHFARDLNIPTQLPEAIELLAGAPVQQIDVGEVNGRYFVNNSSIGLYPRIVHDRETQQRRLGRGKWLAFMFASLRAARYLPFYHVSLNLEGHTVYRRTPFVFVGNNEYIAKPFTIRRARLNQGLLNLFVANHTTTPGLAGMLIRALFSRLAQERDFDSKLSREIEVGTKRRRVKIGIDGEVLSMAPPLRYRIHPGALQVIAPAPDVTLDGETSLE